MSGKDVQQLQDADKRTAGIQVFQTIQDILKCVKVSVKRTTYERPQTSIFGCIKFTVYVCKCSGIRAGVLRLKPCGRMMCQRLSSVPIVKRQCPDSSAATRECRDRCRRSLTLVRRGPRSKPAVSCGDIRSSVHLSELKPARDVKHGPRQEGGQRVRHQYRWHRGSHRAAIAYDRPHHSPGNHSEKKGAFRHRCSNTGAEVTDVVADVQDTRQLPNVVSFSRNYRCRFTNHTHCPSNRQAGRTGWVIVVHELFSETLFLPSGAHVFGR